MHEIAHASIQQEEEGEECDLEQEQSAALAVVALMIIGGGASQVVHGTQTPKSTVCLSATASSKFS